MEDISNSSSLSFLYRIKVSTLSHYALCPERCKIELHNYNISNTSPKVLNINGTIKKDLVSMDLVSSAMHRGTQLHKEFNIPLGDWNTRLFRYKIGKYKVYVKRLDNLEIRGIPDNYQVSSSNEVSIIELKTTNKSKLWVSELESAIFQLQLYIWILKDYLPEGYTLAKEHYIEEYSQRDRKLLKRTTILEDINIEKKIRYIWNSFQGIEKMRPPQHHICKICPKSIRDRCQWREKEIWI